MNSLYQDLRYGWRTLGKSPGFTAVAILTLALGIGANSTIFSWMNSTLLNPIPGVSDTRRLVTFSRGTSLNDLAFSYPDLKDFRSANKSFAGIAGFNALPVNLTGLGKPERVWATQVTTNYFDVLGMQPYRGRGFRPIEEDNPGEAAVVVISYGFWHTHFAGRESALGEKILLNHHPFTIVGIAPPLFRGTQTGLRTELWIPVSMQEVGMPYRGLMNHRQADWLLVIGRLRDNVNMQPAQEEMTLLLQQIARNFPDSHRRSNIVVLDPLVAFTGRCQWRGSPLYPAAHAAGDCRSRSPAGVRQRRQSFACALGRATKRACDPSLTGRGTLATGAAAPGGERTAGRGRRRCGFADHDLEFRHVLAVRSGCGPTPGS